LGGVGGGVMGKGPKEERENEPQCTSGHGMGNPEKKRRRTKERRWPERKIRAGNF